MQPAEPKVPEILSKSAEMSEAVADRMHAITCAAMEPWRPGDKLKSKLVEAARRLGWEPRRARAFYYREARAILAQEYLAACAWYDTHCERLERATEARHELNMLKRQELEGIRHAIAAAGPGMVLRSADDDLALDGGRVHQGANPHSDSAALAGS